MSDTIKVAVRGGPYDGEFLKVSSTSPKSSFLGYDPMFFGVPIYQDDSGHYFNWSDLPGEVDKWEESSAITFLMDKFAKLLETSEDA